MNTLPASVLIARGVILTLRQEYKPHRSAISRAGNDVISAANRIGAALDKYDMDAAMTAAQQLHAMAYSMKVRLETMADLQTRQRAQLPAAYPDDMDGPP